MIAERDIDHWRLWGFTQQIASETITPTHHQPQTNPHNNGNQLNPTHHQQPQTTTNPPANRNNPVQHIRQHIRQQPGTTQPINQQSKETDQNNPPTAQQGPPGATNNPTKPNQLQDNYLLPWGNHLQQPKPLNTVHICLQNFGGGWPTSSKHKKNDNI